MKTLIYLSSLIILALGPNLYADIAPAPTAPPETNPHPPLSSADQKRVEFAETAIQLFLKESPSLPTLETNPSAPAQDFLNKDLACLKETTCFQKDLAWTRELSGIKTQYGALIEQKHAHIIPWSYEKFQKNQSSAKPSVPLPLQEAENMRKRSAHAPMQGPQLKADEYMIHSYARFSKQESEWHHLNVIVTEDKEGKIALRHFFIIPMFTKLPPGVRC